MPFWSWTGTATQSNAAGGVVIIDVTAGLGNVLRVLYAHAVGTFVAADTLTLVLSDEDNNAIVNYSGPTASGTVDMTFPRAATNVDSTTNTNAASSLKGVELAGPDLKYHVETSALAQNDTVQLLLWTWVKNQAGTISVARSTGTVAAPTVTVNEVY